MSSVRVSGKVLYLLPNSLGLGASSGVAGATIKVFDQDPNPVPTGTPGGFVPGTSMNDLILVSTADAQGAFSARTQQWDSVKQVIVTPAVPATSFTTYEPDGEWRGPVWVPNGKTKAVQHTTPAVPATLAKYPDLLVLSATVTAGSSPEQPLPPPFLTDPTRLDEWTFPTVYVPAKAPDNFLTPAEDSDPVRTSRRVLRTAVYKWARNIGALPWLAHCAEVPGTAPVAAPVSAAAQYFGVANALHSLPVPSEIPAPSYLAARGMHVQRVRANESDARSNDAAAPKDLTSFYQNAYPDLTPLPVSVGFDASDRHFVMQRIAGAHPSMIERVTAIPSGFHVTDTHLRQALGNPTATLAGEIANNALFLLDYKILAGLPSDPAGKRFLPAPFALFCRSADNTHLVPVAIQVERSAALTATPLDPGPEVFTPASGDWWTIAKLMVQTADLNVHELKAHLFETHICMEPFAVAAFRELDARHPIAQLLAEHFRDMIFQMYAGRAVLINPSGGVDKLVGTGLAASLQIIDRARQSWNFAQAGLRADLTRRGMLDPATSIPDYPYRDDGLLVLDAIEHYVSQFVNHYYRDDAAVAGDGEVQAWRNAVVDPNQGNLPGVPSIQNRGALVQVVSQIIFTCTAQHAAVNYPQYDFIAFPPNMPAAVYKELPKRERIIIPGTDPHHPGRSAWGHVGPAPKLEEFLPPKDQGIQQVSLAAQLGAFHNGRLGQYADARFGLALSYWLRTDRFASALADQFMVALNGIERVIQGRNAGTGLAQRRIQYNVLLPSMIPNSINI